MKDYYAEPEQRAKYLPIHPSEAHPDNGKLLTLANNSLLPKPSCVNIVDIRTVPHDHVKPSFLQHSPSALLLLVRQSDLHLFP